MLLADVHIEGHTFFFFYNLKLGHVCKTGTEVGITQSKLVRKKQYFKEIQVQGN